jgi:hypothetical protein
MAKYVLPNMQRLLIAAGLAIILCGCATGPFSGPAISLVPPSKLSSEERGKNLKECYDQAFAGARSAAPLTEQEKAPLQGRSTVKFFWEGRPVVYDQVPRMWPSHIVPVGGYISSKVSDRYILCFLARGYVWPDQ